MGEVLKNTLTTFVDKNIVIQAPLKLPKLKTIKLPKLRKVEA